MEYKTIFFLLLPLLIAFQGRSNTAFNVLFILETIGVYIA